jgi:hypothetical protein
MTTGKSTLVVSNWQQIDRGALRGSFTVTLSSGLQIHKVLLFDRNGAQWLSMPSEKYQASTGRVVYKPMVGFSSTTVQLKFHDQVSAAVKAAGWLTAKPPEPPAIDDELDVTF